MLLLFVTIKRTFLLIFLLKIYVLNCQYSNPIFLNSFCLQKFEFVMLFTFFCIFTYLFISKICSRNDSGFSSTSSSSGGAAAMVGHRHHYSSGGVMLSPTGGGGCSNGSSSGNNGGVLPVDDKRLRRQIANCNERRRMQSINAGFQALRQLLPHKDGEKMSKV